jgi:DNA-binding transcriptional regulator YiaG
VTETYRYIHNNLENVHLMNGFVIDNNDPDIGECVSIESINEMNERLLKVMIVQAPYLNGAQLYWLRTEMGYDREQLAFLMKVSVKFLSHFESRARVPIPFFFDQAIREFVCARLGLDAYSGSWTIQRGYEHPYSIRLAIENGHWVGEIAP